jgi:hypothetical protein
LGNTSARPEVPQGTSGTKSPLEQALLEMPDERRRLFWGIEIANEVPKSGTRLDPIIIGILVSSIHAMEALTLRGFFELDLLKK